MKEILSHLLITLGCLLLGSLLVFGARLFHIWCERMQEKTNSEAIKYLLEKVDYIVQICVEATNQTLVNDLKKDGKFTNEQHEIAYNNTMEAISDMITDEDKQKIIDNFGDFGTFLKTSVENYIGSSKTDL